MAKGAIAKEKIKEKILNTFEGSFVYNSGKEIRIPIDEEGNEVQIKVALTCAKDNVSPEGEVMKVAAAPKEEGLINSFPAPHKPAEVTEEEKKNVEDLLKSLGLA
jgi:hypothetical protein